MKLTRASLALVAASLLLPGMAVANPYTYVEPGVVDRDGGDDLGVRLAGSAGVTQPLALFGEVIDAGNYEQLSAGAMYHTPISPEVDLNFGGSMEAVDAGRADDLGLGARMGLRWFVPATRGLELNPELRHIMVFDNAITSVRGNALFPLNSNFHVQGALQAGDDDRIEVGMRYNFGPAAGSQPSY